jgi:hypothetical protein
MNIGVKLSDNAVMLFFECANAEQARDLAESIVEQLKSGGIDLKLIDPVTLYPRDPKEIN